MPLLSNLLANGAERNALGLHAANRGGFPLSLQELGVLLGRTALVSGLATTVHGTTTDADATLRGLGTAGGGAALRGLGAAGGGLGLAGSGPTAAAAGTSLQTDSTGNGATPQGPGPGPRTALGGLGAAAWAAALGALGAARHGALGALGLANAALGGAAAGTTCNLSRGGGRDGTATDAAAGGAAARALGAPGVDLEAPQCGGGSGDSGRHVSLGDFFLSGSHLRHQYRLATTESARPRQELQGLTDRAQRHRVGTVSNHHEADAAQWIRN